MNAPSEKNAAKTKVKMVAGIVESRNTNVDGFLFHRLRCSLRLLSNVGEGSMSRTSEISISALSIPE